VEALFCLEFFVLLFQDKRTKETVVRWMSIGIANLSLNRAKFAYTYAKDGRNSILSELISYINIFCKKLFQERHFI
jgi:hypothetical protein